MAVAVLLAIVGTISTFFGVTIMTMGHAAENPGMSINGWFMLIGGACYAASALRAFGIARRRWRAGTDALWPLAWSLFIAALALYSVAAIGPKLLGDAMPGADPWGALVIALLGATCLGASLVLVIERGVARTVGIVMSFGSK